MLRVIPKSSSTVGCSTSSLGFKMDNLLNRDSDVGCLPTLVGTAKPAEADFPGITDKTALQSRVATPEGVDNPTGDAESVAIDPNGAELNCGAHIVEPIEERDPSLAKEKP
jgi:hypothetical protein